MADTATAPAGELPERRQTEAGGRALAWREAGDGAPLVLLHGIGSDSASWRGQFAGLSDRYRVIAWDAPGYGGSDPILKETPAAWDYAGAVSALLAALNLGRVHLVGHSLGAIMAASFCRAFPGAVRTLTLASPARGYANADPALREERLAQRMHMIDVLGPEGMARERSKALLSPDAPAWALEAVQAVTRTLRPEGYRQATRMLCSSDIHDDLPRVSAPTLVLCGSADTVTPEKGCRRIAEAIPGAAYKTLPGLGHACYVEGPDAFNAALAAHLESHW